MTSPLVILEIHAPNDSNGNPRRASLVIDPDTGGIGGMSGSLIGASEHGHRGARGALVDITRAYPNREISTGPTIHVTASEFRHQTRIAHGNALDRVLDADSTDQANAAGIAYATLYPAEYGRLERRLAREASSRSDTSRSGA